MVSEFVLGELTNKIKKRMNLILNYAKDKNEVNLQKRWELDKEIIDIFLKIKNIKENYTAEDLLDKITNINFKFNKKYSKITKNEIQKYVKEIIEAKPNVDIIGLLAIPELEKFPNNYKIGKSKIINYDKLPKKFKKDLEQDIEYDYNKKKKSGEIEKESKEDYFKKNISDCWVVREVRAVGFRKLYWDAQRLINKDLNILRLTYNFQRDQIPLYHKNIYLYDKNKKQMYKSEYYTNTILYLSHFDDDVKSINKIINKDKKTNIEKRIEITLELAGIAIESKVSNVGFIMMMAAIEGLVLNRSDVLYGLTKQLSTKIPIIIEDDSEKRIELAKLIRHYYGIRSAISHGKKDNIVIHEGDIRNLIYIYIRIVNKLIELQKNKGIKQIKRDGNKPTLDKYIEEICLGK